MAKKDKFDSSIEDQDKFDMIDARREDMAYLPPSSLKFSADIAGRFLMDGWKLKWVRMRLGEQLDTKSIRKRLHPSEGYMFVSPSEFDVDELITLGDTEQYGGTDVITNGDLVLMKVRSNKAEARKQYYQNKTHEQSRAIAQRLSENAIDTKGSRTVVKTGKNAHFAS
jgi:hypothetical protein